jgi:hypothetical protein
MAAAASGVQTTGGTTPSQNPTHFVAEVEIHVAALRRAAVDRIKQNNELLPKSERLQVLWSVRDGPEEFDLHQFDLAYVSCKKRVNSAGILVIDPPETGKVWTSFAGLHEGVEPMLVGMVVAPFSMGSVTRARNASTKTTLAAEGTGSLAENDATITPGDDLIWEEPKAADVGNVPQSIGLKSMNARLTAKVVAYRPTGSTNQNPAVRFSNACRLLKSEIDEKFDAKFHKLRNAVAAFAEGGGDVDALRKVIMDVSGSSEATVNARANEYVFAGETLKSGMLLLAVAFMNQLNSAIDTMFRSRRVGKAMSTPSKGRVDVLFSLL